ncbi:hypothetical protein IKD49_02230 [Candidatus Saccharibacteria bacterium]|nr:hypothetical protein [Candidatus Saccharibacteria bacterium]
MIVKKRLKLGLKGKIFGLFFAIVLTLLGVIGLPVSSVYAEPEDSSTSETTQTVVDDISEEEKLRNLGIETESSSETNQESGTESNSNNSGERKGVLSASSEQIEAGCQQSLGSIGWLVCPTTGKIAEAVDWLYDRIQSILEIEPISMEEGSPILVIWQYCQGLTNIVFIIFLLVVIYSQITGYGITNYGLKKALPKLIVAAIMVNLSFLICTFAVDLSNIVGNGLRGVFTAVEEHVIAVNTANVDVMADVPDEIAVMNAGMYSSLAGGTALAIGAGAIAFESGAIWMLIPVVLGALVSVVAGLITIALRQAVVALLIMISPLAIVASILPNTEDLFKKWKELLKKMLIFYPMFSLLFGASNLAGFAIIASAKDGFGLLLGVAVQIFPLFFSWSLMKMSGTFLANINAKIHSLAAGPLATNRAWAESHRQLTRARFLERNRTPSARLMNFLAYRKTSRDNEIESINQHLKAKYTAKSDALDYDADGRLSKRGQKRYDRQALTTRYSQFSQLHKNNLESGFGDHDATYRRTIAGIRSDLFNSEGVFSSSIKSGATYDERIAALDKANTDAADDLKVELARGAEIEYNNAKGFLERALNAKNADDDRRALLEGNTRHQMHPGLLENPDNVLRYERWKAIMQGRDDGVQTALADAASTARAQAQIRQNKFQAASDLTPATQNVADHIKDLVNSRDAAKNIDAIIGGLRVLNIRGDTDLVARELEHDIMGILNSSGKIELGTYASQAIANFAMFDVKDNDPALRRFGKYINMQTAALYNENDPEKRRKRRDVSWWEYVNSEYVEHDENGNVAHDEDGNIITKKTRGMRELLPGTSYARVERTAYKSQREGVRAASYELDSDGNLSQNFSVKRYFDNMDNLYDATLANIISDQFSYLSGGEQIMAFSKDLTGIGKDGKFDWKYIFGDEINPTIEQKGEAVIRFRNLVKKFLGGHVANQIARSKTDMLQAIRSQYALLDEVLYINDEGKEVVDLERLEEFDRRQFTDGDENSAGSYKNFLREKQDAIKKRFRESFKEEALKTYAKQMKRGYQGDSKEMLSQMLGPEELYDYYFPNGEGNRRTRRREEPDDENEGILIGDDTDGETSDGGIYNDTRERIREIFENYRGARRLNVEEFWNEARDILSSSAEMGDLRVILERFAEGLSQYTDVSQLYRAIIRTFFGSD